MTTTSKIGKTLASRLTVSGLILVDVPITNSFIHRAQSDQKPAKIKIQVRLFKGGCQDICPSQVVLDGVGVQSDSSQASPLETLLSCWETDKLWESNANGPTLFYFAHHPLRMVAAEWMNYLESMFHNFKQYEYSPSTVPAALEHIAELPADIYSLRQWLHCSLSTSQKIRYVIRFLRRHASTEIDTCSSAALMEDYEEISSMIGAYTHRLETTVSVATSLIQAIHSRRSLTETENISRLTYLALCFIPLTFVLGLFSMNERVAPGGNHFWVYFAVSVPLSMAILLLILWPTMTTRSLLAKIWRSRITLRSMA